MWYTSRNLKCIYLMLSADCHHTSQDKGDTIPGLDVSIHDVSICTGFNATSIQTIHEHTQKDESFHLLLDHIHQGFATSIKEMPDCIKPYFTFRDELAVVNGLILKCDRILILKSLCEQCLKHLHKSYMGITKTLAHACTSVFWPDMGKDITNFLSTCSSCAKYQGQATERTIPDIRHQHNTLV